MKTAIRKVVRTTNKRPSTAEPETRAEIAQPIPEKSLADSPEGTIDSDKKIVFLADENAQEIRWNRFKNDRNRDVVKNLIKQEALRMGMIERAEEISSGLGWKETAAVYNGLTVSMVTTLTKCPLKIAETLALTEQEQDAINATGCADRVCKKYLSMDFPYFDEIMLALMLVPIMGTKFTLFSQLMKQWKANPNPVTTVTTQKTGNTGNTSVEEKVA